MNKQRCNGCNREIDNLKENSMTVQVGASIISICSSCAKRLSAGKRGTKHKTNLK